MHENGESCPVVIVGGQGYLSSYFCCSEQEYDRVLPGQASPVCPLESDIEALVLACKLLQEVHRIGVFLVAEFGADTNGEDFLA